MKSSAIARIITWTLVAILLTGILVCGLFSRSFFNFGFNFGFHSGRYTHGPATIDASQIDEVEVEWVSGSVTITQGQDISFKETSNRQLDEEDQLGYRIDGRKLIIVQTDRNYWFRSAPSKDLQLTLPPSLYELSMEAVSADVTMDGLFTINTVDLETVSGRVQITGLSCNEIALDTVSGRMDYTVGATAPRKVEVDAVSADVTLYWPEDAGFTAEIDAVSGSLSSDFSTVSTKGHMVYGNGACEIECDSVSGDLTILKK